jgi:hypothetical protein
MARYKMLSVRVTDQEQAEIKQAARECGQPIDALVYYRIFGWLKA